MNDMQLMRYNILQCDHLVHFTTTICGGVSQGAYGSFNLSQYAGDKAEHVGENRSRLAATLGIAANDLYIPYQTHGDKMLVVDECFLASSEEEKNESLHGVDALITNKKNIYIGITTADCVPLLIYDPLNKVLAAVHAGWKSCVMRIAGKTVDRMTEQFGSDRSQLLVAIGASISPEIFEVGDEVGEVFEQNGFDLSAISFRNVQTGKLHINLWQACKIQLIEKGVLPTNIECANLCTYSNPDQFFSARRQTIHSGRMVTGGMIR